jgi:VanZ family protein
MIRVLLSQPLARALFWIMCFTVIAGALAPQADTPQLFALADKVVHTLAFAALSLVGLRAYPRHLLIVCVLLVALGGLIEIVQGYTSTRAQEWEDFLADILGVVFGALLARCFWPDKQ